MEGPTCSWEGCDREPQTPNARFCNRCYQRWYWLLKKQPFEFVAPHKVCAFIDCERLAPLRGRSDYCKAHQRQARESGGQMWSLVGQWCKECGVPIEKVPNAKTGTCERCLTHRRAYRHGLTPDGFENMMALQGSACAICKTTEPNGRGGLHIDHDHRHCAGSYGCELCFRGLLCHSCNTGLGQFREDAALLEAAASYLRMCEYQTRIWDLANELASPH